MSGINREPEEVIIIDDDMSMTPPMPPSSPVSSDGIFEDEIEVIGMATDWIKTGACSYNNDILLTIDPRNEAVEDAVNDILDSMLAALEDVSSDDFRLASARESSITLVEDDDLEVYDVTSQSSRAKTTLDNSRGSCIVCLNPEEITPNEVNSECVEVQDGDSFAEASMISNYVSFEITDDDIVPGKMESPRKADSSSQGIANVLLARVNGQNRQIVNGDHSTRLAAAAELEDALKVADDLRTSIRDKDSRIAMLEIDVEYARDEVKTATRELDSAKETHRNELESVNKELSNEREINKNLRYNLSEELKERIRELKLVTESEKEVLVKQVAEFKEKEVDYLRKLHDLRTTQDDQINQIRDLRADGKAKGMEADAYRDVAEKLKLVVTRLEKDNLRFQQTIKHMIIEEKKKGIACGPEVITIDTDEADSGDESGFLKDLRGSHAAGELLLDGSRASPSAKRIQSPVQVDGAAKKPKVAIERAAGIDNHAIGEVADSGIQCDLETDKEASLRNHVEELETKLSRLTAENESSRKEVKSSQNDVQMEDKRSDRVDEEPSVELPPAGAHKPSLSVDLIVAARDRLEILLSNVSDELLTEKAKVESLESRLKLAASAKEKVFTDQQNRLEEMRQCVTNLETELEHTRASVMLLEEENSRRVEEECKERQKLNDIEKKMTAIDSMLQAVLQERDELQKQLAVMEAGQVGLQKLGDRNAVLEKDLATAMAERDRLNGLLEQLEERARKADEWEQSVTELKEGVEAARQERTDLLCQLAKRQKEVETIMDACKQTIALADEERKTVLRQCQDSVDDSRRTADALRAQVTDISDTNEQLQHQMEVFRVKLNDAEKQLSEKDAVIALFRSEVYEFREKQASAVMRMNRLCKEVVTTKKKLADTERSLKDASDAAELFTARLNEEKANSALKQQFFDAVREKLASIQADVSSERNGVLDKMSELKGIVSKSCDRPMVSKTFRKELAEFRNSIDERKRELKAIESDVLRDVTELSMLDKSRSESSKELDRMRTELRRLKDELKNANAANDEIRNELKSLKVKQAVDASSVLALAKRVECIGAAEANLNVGVSQLETGLSDDGLASRQKAAEDLDSEVGDVQSTLSTLQGTAEVLSLSATAIHKEHASLSKDTQPNDNLVSSLMEQADVLRTSNEALQSRLNIALANGRRMEKFLQTLQQSPRTTSTSASASASGFDFQTTLRERDDLITKLAESDDHGRRLQAEVVNLTKIIRKLQGKSCDDKSIYVIDLDDRERTAELRHGISSTVRAEKSTRLVPDAEIENGVHRTVSLPSGLNQQVNIEISRLPHVTEKPQTVTNEKLSTQLGTATIKKTLKDMDLNANAGQTVSKKPRAFDNQRALSTITNSIHRPSIVVQDQAAAVPSQANASQSTETCQVQ